MDFGTTNSGMAVYDGRQVRLLPLDPAAANPHVARTALYVTNDQSVAIGREAINRYFEHNVGRPVKMQKVWVGEVDVYGADMFYVTDVYVWADVLSPGRLFLSVKSGLRDAEYHGTVVGRFYYSLENLVALYLSLTRIRAERLLGHDVREVVLGRPVHFARDPDADRLAEQRLLEAAFRAGYERVYLQYEPVAAAYHYAIQVVTTQNVLIFDFGGGTLDLTVLHLDGRGGQQVLATGGIPVAGDIFDQKLVRARLPRHFGEGVHYGARGQELPMPRWIFDVFSDWQRVLELQTPHSRRLLQDIAQTADDRRGIEALISLVANNYALQMFDAAEAAKRRLSAEMAALIQLEGPGFHVTELVTRTQFEQIIAADIQAIDAHLDETVRAAGLNPRDIDVVVRTGGSSEIPAFRYLLAEKFGRSRVQASDTFSSVTSGLGIIGHRIAAGEMASEAHTPSARPQPSVSQSRVPAVNLALLQRRLAAAEMEADGGAQPATGALAYVESRGRLAVATLAHEDLDGDEPIPLDGILPPGDGPGRAAGLLGHDERLLLLTSAYRFLLTTPRHLAELREAGLTAEQFFHLQADEAVCALRPWEAIRGAERLVMVSSRGYARAYPLNGLVEAVEGPVPYQFSQRLPGLPWAALPAATGDELLVALDSGRFARFRLDDLPLLGVQAINRQESERLAGALVIAPGEELAMITADGYGRRLALADVPLAERPNTRGRVMIARRPLAGLASLPEGRRLWALTTRQLRPLDVDHLPFDDDASTRSYRLTPLQDGETVLNLLLSG
jgi:hypothetical chaperone protein